jgi:hypothetical protein
LAGDIRGIGFKTADELAAKLGIDRNSPFRAIDTGRGLPEAEALASPRQGACEVRRETTYWGVANP